MAGMDGYGAANRGPELIAVCATFVSLAIAAVVLRIYVRLRLVKAFGWDDGFMVIALVFLIMYTVTAIGGARWGTGRHIASLDEEHIIKAMRYWYLCYPAYCLSMIAAKISVGLFLLRVTIQPVYRQIIYTVMSMTVLLGFIFFFMSVLQCRPISFFWDKFYTTGTCINIDIIIGMAYAYSAIAALCDFTFGLLPIFLIWNLTIEMRQKFMLIPILSMACVASIAVTVRMAYLTKLKSDDFLWDTFGIAIWSDVEPALAITAGSLATLRPLYRDISKRLGWGGSTTQTSHSGGQKGSRRWYRTPSRDWRRKRGPFSLMSTERSASHDEDLALRMGLSEPIVLRNDLILGKEYDKMFSSWKIEVGDRSEGSLGVERGITRQTDVYLERSHHRTM